MLAADSVKIARWRKWSLSLFWAFTLLWPAGLLTTVAVFLISRLFFGLSFVLLIAGVASGLSSTGFAILVWLATRRFPLWLAATFVLAIDLPAILWVVVDAFLKNAGPLNP
jgi:hypothetical protein